MKKLLLFLSITVLLSCNTSKTTFPVGEKFAISENLKIIPITENVWMHISYLKTQSFGLVACNGMIYKSKKEAFIFDTPISDEVSRELINWLERKQNLTVKGVVINHFHEDCLGGLQAFHDKNIPSYANIQTQLLAKKDNTIAPQNAFEGTLTLHLGKKAVINTYFGEAHTKDNIISWIPDEKVIFGGCMVKSLKAGKGNLADANVEEWSNTISKVKQTYADAKFVIPGHGKYGDTALLDYTIELFRE